jgi:hypothetical protein
MPETRANLRRPEKKLEIHVQVSGDCSLTHCDVLSENLIVGSVVKVLHNY